MFEIGEYLKELQAHLKTGNAREHTYRPAVERLFASFTDVQAANDQARTEYGATDFVFYKKSNINIILGYAEAKDINVSLDKTEKTEQLERYAGYDNLILTNYIEFRFYQNGKCYASVEIAKLNNLSLGLLPENYQILQDELANFFEKAPEKITNAKRLSQIMGAKARRIKTNINILLSQHEQDSSKAAEIYKIYELMKKMLVHDMSQGSFADMYAQTLVYGLFVARYSDETPETFSRAEARDLVPNSNPFLMHFFDHIAGSGFEKRLAVIVDELCDVFAVSEISEIINKYLKLNDDAKQGKDPVIHFYEDFLSEYDPAERKKMGAYYTPLPVVDYMVRAVDKVLKDKFNIAKGLADSSTITKKVKVQGRVENKTYHKVQVLDPATGTATFLNEIIKFAHLKFKGQEGLWPSYARDNLIPRLSGFELMMGAYTIAHLKLGLTLKNLGVDDIGKRLGIYLTNSLEEGIPTQPDLFSLGLAGAVTEEATKAAEIKDERPIMVIIGNPPYSGVSSNETEYANSLINKYKVEPGGKTKLKERKHWLNDDYVKFIAFAEDMVAKNGEGIVAFITNHGYLDNPTFRGMRWHLAQTFDQIDIVDLHGNSKKKEVTPDGNKDENVFNIQQGVAIIIATKLRGSKSKFAEARVADIYGERELKFSNLDADKLKFKKLKLDEKLFYFVDKNTEGQEEYEQGFSVSEIFKLNGVGFVTANDTLNVSYSEKDHQSKINDLLSLDENSWRHKYGRKKDSRDWQYLYAKEDAEENQEGGIVEFGYRPFDVRHTLYTGNSRGLYASPQPKIMQHFLRGYNIGLSLTRQFKTGNEYQHVLVGDFIVESSYVSNRTSEIGSTFPLWLYDEQGNKSSNLNPEIVEKIKLKAGDVDEQDIFDYIYGVLHWPEYREKYKEFLKIDFPRVPYPKNSKEFERFRKAGQRLRKLHLMTTSDIDDLITTYPIAGDNEVVKLKYEDGKVYINKDQYFGDVPEAAWGFYIGGYQPAQKWLKDRKGRILSADDIEHYQRIIKVLSETSSAMKKI
jgi:type I restriction-modification system DNA methylase subunit